MPYARQLGGVNKKPLLAPWFFVIVLIFFSLFVFVQAQEDRRETTFAAEAKNEEIRSIVEEIRVLEEEIRGYREFIQEASQIKKTLKEEVAFLDARIKKTELEIKRLDLIIQENEQQIISKQEEIARLKEKIKREREILAELLRAIYEKEELDMLEIFLQSDDLSDFFSDVTHITAIQGSMQDSLSEVKALKTELERQEQELVEKRNELLEFKSIAVIQKGSLEEAKRTKNDLLKETRGREAEYQNKLTAASRNLTEIRRALYQLTGFGISVSFGDVLEKAKGISERTGTREALLLAVLKKESDWGQNVGSGIWYRDMHPRDWDAFLEITKKLGLDPDTTPVSAKPSYGWGGAMGPAQFLPSTWREYESRVAEITGHNPPSPWNLDDALAAAGIKLAAAGANSQKYEDEWRAAMIYFAGSRWENPAYGFYGDGVLDLANFYQEQIRLLQTLE